MGYRSADCSEKVNDICAQNTCSSHGQLDQLGQCICEAGWTGSDCSIQKCSLDCGPNGSCENNVCVCKPGFSGSQCQDRQCSVHCHLHGQCLNNGTCLCSKGYNGRHCTIGKWNYQYNIYILLNEPKRVKMIKSGHRTTIARERDDNWVGLISLNSLY